MLATVGETRHPLQNLVLRVQVFAERQLIVRLQEMQDGMENLNAI